MEKGFGRHTALIAYTPDYEQIINVAIINQSETPGLGARITEPWFTEQFANKLIADKYDMLAENAENVSDLQVRQITGATLSSKAVVSMITEESKRIIQTIKGEL